MLSSTDPAMKQYRVYKDYDLILNDKSATKKEKSFARKSKKQQEKSTRNLEMGLTADGKKRKRAHFKQVKTHNGADVVYQKVSNEEGYQVKENVTVVVNSAL